MAGRDAACPPANTPDDPCGAPYVITRDQAEVSDLPCTSYSRSAFTQRGSDRPQFQDLPTGFVPYR